MLLVMGSAIAAGGETIRYDRDIRPILSDRCFKCHGPDGDSRQAELRLDERDGAIEDRGGYAPIIPGEPDESEMLRRITSDDPSESMPPPDSNKRRLSSDERSLIRRWIAEGAPYEPHWSLVRPVRPDLPEVRNGTWCRNEVDRFILARLEAQRVEPAPTSDQATLIRRLFLDLTGLPPTPEEIDAFLGDPAKDAFEKLAHRLMTEEPYRSRYAERMAAPWLDAARFADTNGIHMDAGRQMWPWRDWVLRAFHDHMPFDQFLIEQLAGDLLPDATLDQKVASGFNRNHVVTDEGGAIAEEYLVEYAVDRTATTGSVFLGLTLGCARCHEHKFDPISQEEFYQFYAFFNSLDEPGLYSQLPDPNRAFEPFLEVPTGTQRQHLSELRKRLDDAHAELTRPDPKVDATFATYLQQLATEIDLVWEPTEIISAMSSNGATLTVRGDRTILASGENPDQDEHTIRLRSNATGLRLLGLEVIPDPSLPEGRIGRAPNGNAVLTGIRAEAVSVANPAIRNDIRFSWVWADHEQDDGDYGIVNVLDDDNRGWSVDTHRQSGGRLVLLLAAAPIGFEGGTDLIVHLAYKSPHLAHVLGNVRLNVGRIRESGSDRLPTTPGSWFIIGPFPHVTNKPPYETSFGPEEAARLDLQRNFGFGGQFWRHDPNLRDDKVNMLSEGANVTYVGRYLYAATPRTLNVSLGSDDGFQLYLNGKLIASRQIDRAPAADQDHAQLNLSAGENLVVMKIVNTNGGGGFYYRTTPRDQELIGDLVMAILPKDVIAGEPRERLNQAWRLRFSPKYMARQRAIDELEQQLAELKAQVPLTMVMHELPSPRETYVLIRGAYDKPDKDREVTRGIPKALGQLPAGAPVDRLGLAQWMIAADNPLVARVAVNRLWELFFGSGIVRTTEDFGLQGEWPSHPELLDWLAVEFRESGWDIQHLIRLFVTSSTYRQSARVRPELREIDPDNRWLAYFPRRRLSAEQIRDQALYVSGLLVESFGGPSVKPYQPDGLWQEVAMVQSNTREYEMGTGPDLRRRSLYTYWKRACPPPSLMTFDAPTREFCTIRRATTNTPLQALVLWNDPQFVEAARGLAQRTLTDERDDHRRLVHIFRRCTGRMPEPTEVERLSQSLATFRGHFLQQPEEAARFLEVGQTPVADQLSAPELAAWSMLCNAILNLSETLVVD